MSRTQVIQNELWQRDISCLSSKEQNLAEQILDHSKKLGGIPYHRDSKKNHLSDRQTIIKHPETQKAFLVITICPILQSGSYQLRVDFFDRRDEIRSDIFAIEKGPRGQWENKKEKRFVVRQDAKAETLKVMVDQIFTVNSR
ncbi:MAG: hypothetical protein ABIF87_04815 [Pseudomonadota bacterium]